MNVVLGPGRLGDPFVARWVMERIKDAREIGDQGQVDELEALFDEMTLRRIIERGRTDLVADIFINLRTSLFAPVQKYLLNNWLSWKGVIACWSALKIAELAPQDFRRVLTKFVESPEIVLDKNRLSGVFQAVASMGKDAADIAKALVAKVEAEGDKRDWWDLLSEMVRAATSSGIDEGITLLVRGFEEAEAENEKQYLEASLSAVYKEIAPALPYLRQIRDMSEKHTRQRFGGLSELFDDSAPLNSIDKASRAKGQDRRTAAMELLPEESDASKVVGLARRLSGAVPKLLDKQNLEILGSFLLAATAAHHARRRFTFEGYEISSLLSIASYDILDLPCYQAVFDALKRFQSEEVAQPMVNALRKARNHYGGIHLARMMGDLRHPVFVDPLIECINKSSGDFIAEAAMRALAKIGAEAQQALMSRWGNFDSSQRIYGYGVLKRAGGDERTVRFLEERFAEVRPRPNDLELWCSAAEAVPDRRLVELMEAELHRKLFVVDDSYSTLCAVLDIERPNLEEARKRVEQDNDKISGKSLDEITVGDAMDQAAKMELRCVSCGETNQFEMPGIYISPEHPKDGFCIGGDISCPSCGSFGPFEPGAMGMMAVTAELLKLTMAATAGVEYRGPLQFCTVSLHDGRLVSPSTALKQYRRRVERDPTSVPDSLGLGNIYMNIGSQKLAAGCFSKCLAIEPQCAEAARSLAKIRLDSGDMGGAFELLEDAWRLREQWRFHRLRDCSPEDFTSAFIDMYNTLATKLGKQKLSSPGLKATLAVRQAVRHKVGRNAPCPCGSGKKYKKCCEGDGDF